MLEEYLSSAHAWLCFNRLTMNQDESKASIYM